jgi:hypothetical protein
MGREQHTIITEGATLTMGEELFKPSPTTQDIVGCCGDLYMESLNTFIFALVFSSEVGVYDGRQGIPGETPTLVAEGLTKGFEGRLKVFGNLPGIVITVPDTLKTRSQDVATHIATINDTFRGWANEWEHHLTREVWMFSLKEAKDKGIEQSEVNLDAPLPSNDELEKLISGEYVEAMHLAVRTSIGNRTPKGEFLVPFIKKNVVAHIGAHLAYDTALQFRNDLGENRSLVPHPTRQTLIRGSVQSLIDFAVPAVLYEIVMNQGAKSADDLRQKLGNYTESPHIIDIQKTIAKALAASHIERIELLSKLTTATTNALALFPIHGVDTAIRQLAMMRAHYQRGESEYNAKLRKIFPTLAKPAPAQDDRHAQVREGYRKTLPDKAKPIDSVDIGQHMPRQTISEVDAALERIPAGREYATRYHEAILGLLTEIFDPDLTHPVMEQEVDQGPQTNRHPVQQLC